MSGFARCEYFDCGKAAVVCIKLEMMSSHGVMEEPVTLVLSYCAACYEIVRANEMRSTSFYTELREQGCSEKMANHVMLARMAKRPDGS